jgi:hypothetical protein
MPKGRSQQPKPSLWWQLGNKSRLFYFILDGKNVPSKKQGNMEMLFLHQVLSNTRRIYDPNSNHELLGKKMFIHLFNQTP